MNCFKNLILIIPILLLASCGGGGGCGATTAFGIIGNGLCDSSNIASENFQEKTNSATVSASAAILLIN